MIRGRSYAVRSVAALMLLSAGARAEEGAPAARASSPPRKQATPPKIDPGAEAPARRKNELTLLPVIGGDSDIGVGGGYIASFAHLSDVEPYRWRAEAAGSITFKEENGGVNIPYIDNYFLITLPHLIENVLSFEARLSHTHEELLGYYGLGNRVHIPEGADVDALYFKYRRTHPRLELGLRYVLVPKVELSWGISYTYNVVSYPEGGRLAQDLASDDPALRRLLRSSPEHGVVTFSYGIGFDTRDSEVNAERGQYHTLRLDLSPGGGAQAVPFGWSRTNLALRGYLTLIAERLVLASRLVVDALAGHPPFYELSRYDNTYAIGGGKGVRGIPAQRYHGMLKLFTNIELRALLVPFRALGKRNVLGVAGFVDAGRLWADYRQLPALDGTGLGLKLGLGGGLRLLAGSSFVLRADLAGSPTDGSLGAYLAAGQLF